MINIDAITKDIGTLADYLWKGTAGWTAELPPDKAAELDEKAYKVFQQTSSDIIMAKLSKIHNANVCAMNARFFEHMPKIWSVIQNSAEIAART